MADAAHQKPQEKPAREKKGQQPREIGGLRAAIDDVTSIAHQQVKLLREASAAGELTDTDITNLSKLARVLCMLSYEERHAVSKIEDELSGLGDDDIDRLYVEAVKVAR